MEGVDAGGSHGGCPMEGVSHGGGSHGGVAQGGRVAEAEEAPPLADVVLCRGAVFGREGRRAPAPGGVPWRGCRTGGAVERG